MPAVRNSVAVLRRLAASSDPITAAALARHTGVPRSTMYQLLGALADEGLVARIPERHAYTLGVGVFEMGSAYLRHNPLEHLASPLVARLADRTGETAQLGILHGNESMYLLKMQPERPTALVTAVGVRLPAHLTASGRSMLAALPSRQVAAVFAPAGSFVNRTGEGPQNLRELKRILADDRKRGYSQEVGSVTEGIVCIAAPVFDYAGLPVASVVISFVRESRPEDAWAVLAGLVLNTARALTTRLGGQQPASVR